MFFSCPIVNAVLILDTCLGSIKQGEVFPEEKKGCYYLYYSK